MLKSVAQGLFELEQLLLRLFNKLLLGDGLELSVVLSSPGVVKGVFVVLGRLLLLLLLLGCRGLDAAAAATAAAMAAASAAAAACIVPAARKAARAADAADSEDVDDEELESSSSSSSLEGSCCSCWAADGGGGAHEDSVGPLRFLSAGLRDSSNIAVNRRRPTRQGGPPARPRDHALIPRGYLYATISRVFSLWMAEGERPVLYTLFI